MARLDECGMASAFALAAVLLLLAGTVALLVLSGHNRLAAREAVQTTRLLEAARSGVRLGAVRLEAEADLRRPLETGAAEVEAASGYFEKNDAFYRVTAKRLPTEDTPDGAAYLLTAASWPRAGSERQATVEISGKRAYAAALYRLEGTRLSFVRWER
ncbi:transcriptional regulator [uncultured Selenomonas sp.]|uniref:transcriptional regulator n=1 Tax=uncultured Selenomonas sp. TaxID=159275 RepID=UPI0025E7AAF7|nr:transcriptional regulator [uncultured Selenomonas sp.]